METNTQILILQEGGKGEKHKRKKEKKKDKKDVVN